MVHGETNDVLEVDIIAQWLKSSKKCFCFGKNDIFFTISRGKETDWNEFIKIFPTQTIPENLRKGTLNPSWIAFKIMMRTISNGDPTMPIKIEFFAYRKDGHHVALGS